MSLSDKFLWGGAVAANQLEGGCVCAEITAVDATTDAATATAAGSLSYCFCCAAMAADVDADNHRLLAEGPLPLPF